MTKKAKGIDWSKRPLRQMLVEQRKFLWPEDTVAKLAAWMGLRPGMTAVDVGCGLGYLGYTYWPYFGKGGRYFGVTPPPSCSGMRRSPPRPGRPRGKLLSSAGVSIAFHSPITSLTS